MRKACAGLVRAVGVGWMVGAHRRAAWPAASVVNHPVEAAAAVLVVQAVGHLELGGTWLGLHGGLLLDRQCVLRTGGGGGRGPGGHGPKKKRE